MNLDGTRLRKLLEPWPRTGGTTDPIVSPNGRLLSVIGDDGSTKGPGPGFEDANGLFVSRIDGSGFRQLMPFTSDQSLKHGYGWDVRPASWARHACAVAGRRLTRSEWAARCPGATTRPPVDRARGDHDAASSAARPASAATTIRSSAIARPLTGEPRSCCTHS